MCIYCINIQICILDAKRAPKTSKNAMLYNNEENSSARFYADEF